MMLSCCWDALFALVGNGALSGNGQAIDLLLRLFKAVENERDEQREEDDPLSRGLSVGGTEIIAERDDGARTTFMKLISKEDGKQKRELGEENQQ
jgi:hypothetical protein